MEDLTGKQFGSYQIVAPLGEGGMAAVYKAYQPSTDRYVALKILPRHFASDPQFVARFEQEAKVLAQLQHPHILPVFDYGQADGYAYIVMPFLQSGDLTDLLKGQPLSLDLVCRIISQIGDALDYAHSRGLVHRDVKPSNVLLDERGNCLLTDFGLAKILESSSKLTATGGILGTPAYMSPEQGLAEKVDGRSDIYSLGIVLYELTTGRVPYQAETPMAVVIKHMNDPLPPPRRVNPALPETVERIILKALAKQPEDRFATAGEMAQALQAALAKVSSSQTPADNEAIAAGTATKPMETESQKKRLTRKWVFAAGGATVLLVGAVIFFVFGNGGLNAPTVRSTYDDFSNPVYDGVVDTNLWNPEVKLPNYIEQREGVLVLSFEPGGQDDVVAVTSVESLASNQFNFAEAKILLSGQETGQDGDFSFILANAYSCVIGRGYSVRIWCEAREPDSENPTAAYTTAEIVTNYDVWHTVRIEMDPEINVTFYIDGKQVGSYKPNADGAKQIKDRPIKVRLSVWGRNQEGIQVHCDDVRIGQYR